MMIKTTLYSLALLGLMVSGAVKAQEPAGKIICGDQIIKQKLNDAYPGYLQSVNETFNQAKEKSKNSRSSMETVYTVNVVVHVVYKDAVENLEDSVIQSQIDVLNEDYNRLNPDSMNTRSVFQDVVGSGNIHFNLAQVVRKPTTETFTIDLFGGGMPNQMKWDSLGGSSAIDPDHFLNIWVVKMQSSFFGQILGFAFPPNNLANWPANSGAPVTGEDGVVIDFRCFGRNNPNILNISGFGDVTIKGRTPVHEVGHYLGLRHIWGDGGSPFGGGNNCAGEDGIDDTPKANDQSSFDCDTTKNSCVDSALPWTTNDAPDMIENYMDYSAETCMNGFTKGQFALMRSVLEGPRLTLLQPAGLKNKVTTNNFAKISPNPANSHITVSAMAVTISSVKITDLCGKVVLNKSAINLTKTTIDLSDVSNGTYFVTVTESNGSTMMDKIIVTK